MTDTATGEPLADELPTEPVPVSGPAAGDGAGGRRGSAPDGGPGGPGGPPTDLRRAAQELIERIPRPLRRPVALVAAVAIGWPTLAAVLPQGMPAGIVLLGVALGSLTGLTAMGLVLVHRASRIVNFAQASLGAIGGVLAIMLFNAWHVNYFLAFPIGIVVAAGAGAVVDRLVVRRFFWAPRLILTLATIGLAQILGGFELLLPKWFGQPLITTSFHTPLSWRFTIAPIQFTGNHVMIFVLVPVVCAALGWFLKATSAGIAIRAASENAERAMVLGIPVRRLSTIVWAIAAVLSGLAVLLTAPIQPLPPSVITGPTLLLPALAAAVVAGMESLPVAFVTGILIGISEQVTFWNTSRSSTTDVALLVLVVVVLLFRRQRSGRGSDDLSSWVGAQETPPMPRELAPLPEVRWGRWVLYGLGLLVLLVVPAFLSVSQLSILGTVTVAYALVGISLVILTGWAGQLSLGQFAIAAVGAVAAANMLDHRVDLIFVLLGSAAAGGVASLIVGLPALRVKGMYLGVATLALAVAMSSYFLNPAYFPKWLPQSVARPVAFTRFDLADEKALYYLAVGLLVLALVCARGIKSARAGRVMVAVRDNEPAAQARGIPTTAVKLMAFAVAGVFAGLGGAIHALVLQAINFGTYSPSQSFEAFSMVVIGGLTSAGGAVVGALALRWAEYAIGGGLQLIVTGSGVLLLLLVFPGGLGQVALRARQVYLRAVARRRGVIVPSLVADARTEAVPDVGARTLNALFDDADSVRSLMMDDGDREVETLRREADELRARLDELERHVVGRSEP